MNSERTNIGKAPFRLALAVVATGIGVLVGWSFDVSMLKSLVLGAIPMNPTTAVVFILAGTSLAFSLWSSRGKHQKSPAFDLTARVCAMVVTLVGLLKLGGYGCGVDLGFDRWLFASQLSIGGHPLPIRIAPNTALDFFLLGAAFLLVDVKRPSVRVCVELLMGLVLCDSLFSVLGYVYQVQEFYSVGGFAPMSIYTAIFFFTLSAAFLLSRTDTGLLSVITGKSASGTIARRLIPAAILIPAFLGWLELHGELEGFFDSNQGHAIFALANIVIFILITCWIAITLFNADREREEAETKLIFNEQRYRSLVEATTSIVWDTPASGDFEMEQPGWTAFTGQTFEELRGWGWLNAIHPDDQAETKRLWSTAHSSRSTYEIEHRLLARDGTYHDMSGRAVPILSNDGTILQWIGVHTDITERKRSEEALRLLSSAVLQSKESILITDAELDLPGPKIIFTNPAFTAITGFSAEEAIGKTPRILQGALTDKAVLRRLRQNLEDDKIFEGEAINYRKDGTVYNQEWQIAPIHNSQGKTTHFVAIQRDITERKRIEARYRQLVESNVQGVFFFSRSGGVSGANDAFLHLLGYTREDLAAGLIDWMALTPPEYAPRDQLALEEVAANGVCRLYEKEYIAKNGTRVPIILAAAAFADNPDEGVCFVVDLTERKSLEARLYQSQKMETIGKLAGGVAHEFNSILTAIIGQSELLLGDLPADSPEAKSVAEISKAAIRAANLTRQLLAYGRKQLLEPQILDLNSVVGDMESTLQHLLGQEADLRIVPAIGLKAVKADAGQVEQVIMNIVLNAHEAMPNGGKVTLETANVSISPEKADAYLELKAGDYVMLAITDTGTGMSAEVQARIFEPFFSTKGVGQGTGLGLSTSYGIIKQSGGNISVYSEPARGTTFKIYLPQVDDQPRPIVEQLDSPTLPRGTETILLAEDDPALRKMAATLLEKLGYKVFTAANGIEALSLKQQRDIGHIDLLFTDVVMPHMSGKELSERIHSLYPQTKILFTSAFTENAFVHQGVLTQGVTLLQKPFTPSVLARKLREVLDR